jgi:hypothetical protein
MRLFRGERMGKMTTTKLHRSRIARAVCQSLTAKKPVAVVMMGASETLATASLERGGAHRG